MDKGCLPDDDCLLNPFPLPGEPVVVLPKLFNLVDPNLVAAKAAAVMMELDDDDDDNGGALLATEHRFIIIVGLLPLLLMVNNPTSLVPWCPLDEDSRCSMPDG